MVRKRGRPSKGKDEFSPKPTHPIKVSSQLCFFCDKRLDVGVLCIAHRVNPVVLCLGCGEEKEKTSQELCRAIVDE